MHLTVIVYGAFIIFSSIMGFELYQIALVLFLLLKTLVDLIMHIVEHNGFENADSDKAKNPVLI